MLNDGMDLSSIRRDGCIDRKDNTTKWRVYRDSQQKQQSKNVFQISIISGQSTKFLYGIG